MDTKPGYKTTEFWLSLLATLLGFLLASGAMDAAPADSWIAKLVGGVVAVLATLGYSASRETTSVARLFLPIFFFSVKMRQRTLFALAWRLLSMTSPTALQ